MKTGTVLSFDVMSTLIRDAGKSWNVSACLDSADSFLKVKGSWVMYLPLLVPPSLATPTHHVKGLRIRRPALHQSCLLM
jgi:hypothetical protein